MNGRDFLNYFVAPDGSPWLNSFGLGNWTGLAALVIVVGFLAISSDVALRKLKARPWKRQRLNYGQPSGWPWPPAVTPPGRASVPGTITRRPG